MIRESVLGLEMWALLLLLTSALVTATLPCYLGDGQYFNLCIIIHIASLFTALKLGQQFTIDCICSVQRVQHIPYLFIALYALAALEAIHNSKCMCSLSLHRYVPYTSILVHCHW